MDFNILNAEKKIAENKNKFLAQKRSEEEISDLMHSFVDRCIRDSTA